MTHAGPAAGTDGDGGGHPGGHGHRGPLAHRRAVVAGSGSPVTAATVARLTVEGVRVVRLDADRARSAEDLEDHVGRARRELGGLDLVVVVVPDVPVGPFVGSAAPVWAAGTSESLSTTIALARACVDDLLAAATSGAPADLVLVGSAEAQEVGAAGAVLAAVAAAVTRLARALRTELAPSGVRVRHVAQGRLTVDGEGGPDVDDVARVVAFTAALPAATNLAEVSILPTAHA